MSRALKRIESQKIVLMFDFIMWGIAASLLKIVKDDTCETCYTDAEVIGYNEQFIETLNDQELLSLLAHEVLHVLLGHCFRAGSKNLEVWNDACDYVVNLILCSSGFVLPKNWLYDVKYKDMSAEEVYYLLMKEKDSQKSKPKPSASGQTPSQGQSAGQKTSPGQTNAQSKDSDAGGNEAPNQSKQSGKNSDGSEAPSQPSQSGEGSEGEGGAPESPNDTEELSPRHNRGEIRPNTKPELVQQWQHQALVAAAQAKQRGQLPGSVRRVILEANSPEIDFVALSYLFVQKLDASDYTWTRPNQNYLYQGFYAPSLHTKRLGPMIFGNDTSGSVSDFQQAVCEKLLINLMNDTRPESLTVIHCDAAVQKVETFDEFDQICIKPVGGGGTDFRPVFAEIAKLDVEPAGLIYLTDMDGTFPDKEPDYPVLWLSTVPNRKAPFGETVFLDLRNK